jgi:D-aminopeptidase
MTNFGLRDELVVGGVPVGRRLSRRGRPDKPAGSCIGIVVTDAAVDGASCARLARRVGLGLARAGSVAHHGSGEIFLAFATAREPAVPDSALDDVFAATVEATEEAVLNALWAGEDEVGREGRTALALPRDEVLTLLARYGRVSG